MEGLSKAEKLNRETLKILEISNSGNDYNRNCQNQKFYFKENFFQESLIS